MYWIQIGTYLTTKEDKKQINFLLHNKRPFYQRKNAFIAVGVFFGIRKKMGFYPLLNEMP